MIYRALTVKQPWASLLVAGIKTIENRSWTTNYRGPLAIHAGQGVERNARAMIERSLGWPLAEDDVERYRLGETLPAGAIVGVVELLDVVPVEQVTAPIDQPWRIGPYCWLVRPLREYAPREMPRLPGKLGLWHWESDPTSWRSRAPVG